jgi:cell division septation protein DedD
MTPVLLDQRSVFKAGITISLGMLVVFFCGYYFGHHKAVSGGGMELNQTIALALPRPAHAETDAFEPQLPQQPGPGADIDVDSPDELAVVDTEDAAASEPQSDASAAIDAAIEQTTDSIESPIAKPATGTAGAQPQLASLGSAPAVFDAGAGSALTETRGEQLQHPDAGHQPTDAPAAGTASAISDTANAEDARYTIQVGVFADEDNALRRLSELESLQLSAYVNEHTNKREEIRYSVRFGYFKNKSSAVAALDVFEQNLSGSGYVARIRRAASQ